MARLNQIEPARPGTLSKQISNSLRDAIVGGEYRPGHRLILDELAERLGVSRTPLRDALSELASLGLVEPLKRGYRVVAPSSRDMIDQLEVYAALEAVAIRLAIERATPDMLKAILHAAKVGPVQPPYEDPELDFHQKIIDAAQSPHFSRVKPNSFTTTLGENYMADIWASERDAARHQHIALAEAIMASDVVLATALSAVHWQSARAKLLRPTLAAGPAAVQF